MVGFCSFGVDGRVPGGDYPDGPLDVGMGMRPDLTAAAWGRGICPRSSPSRGASSAPRNFARPSRRSTPAPSACASRPDSVGSGASTGPIAHSRFLSARREPTRCGSPSRRSHGASGPASGQKQSTYTVVHSLRSSLQREHVPTPQNRGQPASPQMRQPDVIRSQIGSSGVAGSGAGPQGELAVHAAIATKQANDTTITATRRAPMGPPPYHGCSGGGRTFTPRCAAGHEASRAGARGRRRRQTCRRSHHSHDLLR